MTSLDPASRPALSGLVAGVVALIVALPVGSARAQAPAPAPADKAAGLFDDAKPAATTKEKDPARPTPGGAADREVIGFTQDNATSQMTELEERMFRLSEALRGLEPENASRLRLALKFSKEELILEQMRETHKLLKETQLTRAETEVRELLAKLEHLRNVLLAEDLDFQLKLARLRQLRETMGQLDRIVKEERRALGWSRFAIDQREAKTKLGAVRPDLEALGRDQKGVLADTRAITPDRDPSNERKSARAALRQRELSLGKTATALALNPLFADFQPSELRKVDGQLGEAASRLDGDDLAAATTAEEKGVNLLDHELQSLDSRIAEADRDVAEAEFRRHEVDQAKNRQAAAALGASSSRLGDSGVALQKDLIRAGAAMATAERNLAKTAADPAAVVQTEALDILAKSAADLARAAEKLLVELRIELQSRLITELTEMHEAETYIRETTQAQVPRLAQKSRSAAIAVAGLAQKQGDQAGRTEQLLALVEETEYGIALPTTLKVLGREMREIAGWLKALDAAPRTVAAEQRIEDDLLALLQAIRRLSPTTPPPAGTALPSDLRERERELNRLIAELKMVRLLQARLNVATVGVDKTRPNPADLSPALRREVEALEAYQEEIRDSLARITERIGQP